MLLQMTSVHCSGCMLGGEEILGQDELDLRAKWK
jgi:hypothetical protein